MYDVNLTRFHLLLKMFEHNNNLSSLSFYWREWQVEFDLQGILAESARDIQKVLLLEV